MPGWQWRRAISTLVVGAIAVVCGSGSGHSSGAGESMSSTSTTESSIPHYHSCLPSGNGSNLPYCNWTLPISIRVTDLVSRLTLLEKHNVGTSSSFSFGCTIKVGLIQISGCTDKMPADGGATRIGLEPYNWGTEMLHGAQSMCAGTRCPTIFPVLSLTAATFNRTAWKAVGSSIGDEMRAINNNASIGRTDCTESGPGVSGWGPNVNLVRDPRWGRNIEVPTEDPFLAGELATAWIRGVQGDDPKYVKIAASIKHFSVYSMEASGGANRKGFDPNVTARDVAESYLPMFKAGIVDGGALGMMCSYTSLNGTAFCESDRWIQRWAREKHGFQGNVVTDCGALSMPGPEGQMDAPHNAAKALLAGADLNCGQPWAYTPDAITTAITTGLVPMSALDAAVARSLNVRMKAGLFDPLDDQPYTKIGIDQLGSAEHHALALEVAAQGLVLLRNPTRERSEGDAVGAAEAAILPFAQGTRTAVIGPHATSRGELLGTYFDLACPPNATAAVQFGCIESPLEAIQSVNGVANTVWSPGCSTLGCDTLDTIRTIEEANRLAATADQVVLLVGISQQFEGEGKDRHNTRLPGQQEALVATILALGKPTVVVMFNGGIVSIDHLPAGNAAAVEAFYPGVRGAQALAQALFGQTNRWGKLPVTIYSSSYADQVDMLQMSFFEPPGRTYKFWDGDTPLWDFGVGLSYTQFALTGLVVHGAAVIRQVDDVVHLSITVANTGGRDGDEVVMLFHTADAVATTGVTPKPKRRLIGFERVHVRIGMVMSVNFTVGASDLSLVTSVGDTMLFPGMHGLVVSTGDAALGSTANVSVDLSSAVVLDSLPPVDPPI